MEEIGNAASQAGAYGILQVRTGFVQVRTGFVQVRTGLCRCVRDFALTYCDEIK